MDSRASSLLAVTGLTVLGGAIAYAAYFDHKRRNDADFRKKLRKEKKRVEKVAAQSKESLSLGAKGEITHATLEEALEQLKKEEPPHTPEEREGYFMQQVAMGEQLSGRGPEFHLEAALSFYRALRVYPAPMELIVIYEKTVPQPIFKLVMDMTSLDVSKASTSSINGEIFPDDDEEMSPTSGGPPSEASSQEWDKVTDPGAGYYEEFPPKSMNTRIETRGGRKVLVVGKDIAAGELIYKEQPVVAVLDPDLQGSGKYCAHCLRSIDADIVSIGLPEGENPISSTFCSKECLVDNRAQSHNLLFTLESPLPAEMTQPVPLETKATVDAARKTAQETFVKLIKEKPHQASLLVARFIARQVAVETTKLMSVAGKQSEKSNFTDAPSGTYLLADHMERLRYLETKLPEGSLPALVNVLQTALPGLEHFVTDERYSILIGKMMYNAYGVSFDGGRDDKPAPTARPEDVEKTRTPNGTAHQVGTAFYTLSSYLTHSCAPNVRPSFSSGTSELHLIANRDLKEGEELNVAFVDVTQKNDETIIECRRRRRVELARGWRFACPCERCMQEAKDSTDEEKDADSREEKDGSKVESSNLPL
ncbi:hypothetical protein H0H87_009352 [Tephrocybe sp. NHM501043]|nr:hypothetical protein H0H87_009352 [Tephrocybe sp. NHM501043]